MGAGLVIDGGRVPVAGVDVVTWLDDPRVCPRITDGRARAQGSALAVVMHTSRGRRAIVRDGARPSDRGERLARYQSRTARKVSWHLTGDTDGQVFQQADLATWLAWHVEEANGWTIGYELVQHRDAPDLWRVQIAAAVAVVSEVCGALRIPRRLLVGPDGAPWTRPVPELLMKKYGGPGGKWPGVLGHCQLVPDDVRGPGDPGDAIFRALLEAGFEGVPVAAPARRSKSPAAAPPAAAAPPPWADASQEIRDTTDRDTKPEDFVRDAARELAALGVTGARACEAIAHCATECSWGRRAIGGNCGGVKLKQRDDAASRAKRGRGLAFWRAPGHRDAGDDATEFYRAFDGPAEFWPFFLKRYCPRPETPAETERYEEAGAAFWGDDPSRWFPELVLAGYRGEVREAELEHVLASGQAPEAHPSVAAHRGVVARVRAMLSP